MYCYCSSLAYLPGKHNGGSERIISWLWGNGSALGLIDKRLEKLRLGGSVRIAWGANPCGETGDMGVVTAAIGG